MISNNIDRNNGGIPPASGDTQNGEIPVSRIRSAVQSTAGLAAGSGFKRRGIMQRMGPRCKKLSPQQINLLTDYKNRKFYSLPQLLKDMEAPFCFRSLVRALDGHPIREVIHSFIVRFIEDRIKNVSEKTDVKS